MKRHRWFTGTVALGLYALLYTPIVVIVLYSFLDGGADRTLTLRWYRQLFHNPTALEAVKHTLLVAVTSTLVATLLGTFLGLALSRAQGRAGAWIGRFVSIPIFVPDIVLATGLLLFFGMMQRWFPVFGLGLGTMIMAHITFQVPFVAMAVKARLTGIDPALAEAASDLGATPSQSFWHVTLPLLVPGILAGGMLAFTLSLDDFAVSFFTGGSGSVTVPILIYASVKRGITPEINALSSLIIAASIAATIMIVTLQRRREN
jgi:spermidine/putrescine transport system permease protein